MALLKLCSRELGAAGAVMGELCWVHSSQETMPTKEAVSTEEATFTNCGYQGGCVH